MLFGLYNFGTQELIILVIMGTGCLGVVVAAIVLAVVLTRKKDEPRND